MSKPANEHKQDLKNVWPTTIKQSTNTDEAVAKMFHDDVRNLAEIQKMKWDKFQAAVDAGHITTDDGYSVLIVDEHTSNTVIVNVPDRIVILNEGMKLTFDDITTIFAGHDVEVAKMTTSTDKKERN